MFLLTAAFLGLVRMECVGVHDYEGSGQDGAMEGRGVGELIADGDVGLISPLCAAGLEFLRIRRPTVASQGGVCCFTVIVCSFYTREGPSADFATDSKNRAVQLYAHLSLPSFQINRCARSHDYTISSCRRTR